MGKNFNLLSKVLFLCIFLLKNHNLQSLNQIKDLATEKDLTIEKNLTTEKDLTIEKDLATEKDLVIEEQLIYKKVQGIEIPSFVKLEGEKRVLNGYGYTTSSFFKVKVSLSSLYVKEKSSNGDLILNSKSSKLIRMVFVRTVSKEQLQKSFRRAFEKMCNKKNGECKKFYPATKYFNSLTGFKKYDILDLELFPSKINIKKNNNILEEIYEYSGFGEILLRYWIGPRAYNKSLKKNLLRVH